LAVIEYVGMIGYGQCRVLWLDRAVFETSGSFVAICHLSSSSLSSSGSSSSVPNCGESPDHPSPNCGESPNPLLLCYLLLPHLHPPLLNQQFVRADNAKACDLCWKTLSWLGTISLTSANDVLDPVLWETFFSTTLGSVVPLLSSLLHHNNSPHVQCGCKKLRMDFRIRRT